MVSFSSKHGIVRKTPAELYMGFADMRNFIAMLPEDKRDDITADYDTLNATVQGFSIGVKVKERIPYSKIVLVDNGAPFGFSVNFNFEPSDAHFTDFSIDVEADLNFMMKTLLAPKIREALDKVVDTLAQM